jgi:FkbM family methyltransferase
MDISALRRSSTCQLPLLLHFYEKYLPQLGTFVEIGAYDGESFSNSSCLADAGWTGYYVEPVPEYGRKCAARHARNRVKVFNLAISDADGLLDLNVGGAFTTASGDALSAFGDIVWSKATAFDQKISVRAMTLDKFLAMNAIAIGFELLIVDVEGYEEKVLGTFGLDYWRPKMLIVELNDYHADFVAHPAMQMSARRVRDKIIAARYMQVYADAINTIFVHDSMILHL